MRNVLWLFSFTLLMGCSEETRQIKTYPTEQFYQNIHIGGGAFSPDESRILFGSNESGMMNAFSVDLLSGEQTQLTHSTEESYYAQSYFPADERFIVVADKGGNENEQIFMVTPDGQEKLLTPHPDTKSTFLGWTGDEQSMLFLSNMRDPRFMDVYKMPIESMEDDIPASELIYQNDEGFLVRAISPDERYTVLIQVISNADSKMYLHDNHTGETTDISEHEGNAYYDPQFFSLDNTQLYFATDEGSDFIHLSKINLETLEVDKVFEPNWDVSYAYQSKAGKYQVIGINEDSKTVVKVVDQASGEAVELPEIPGSSIQSVEISDSENLARLIVSTSATPSNMYVYQFDTGELKQLTHTLNPAIDAQDMVEGKVVRYPSFDGLEIPAIYFQPHQASKSNPVPALIWAHGGPGEQSFLAYNSLFQSLLNQGYAVLAVNNRGSNGYGKAFHHLDDQNHGDKDLKDHIAGKEFLASTGVIDMDKVGIMGPSYGGFIVMSALTTHPDEFAVGINMFGVMNWLRTLKSMPPFWEAAQKKAFYDEIGNPYTQDSVRLYNISPLFHANLVTKPLMVFQGARDRRVPQVESDEIVAAVKEAGVPVEYVVFEDEGHGFRKKKNLIEGNSRILEFLDRYLKGETDESSEEPQ
ncbi:S9 family peptidase [Pontibacter sp. G13]|uniref:S9 family peptidase n=1 Tax=Pontibacter sp. G13 TaxID=3074898 RepID=UPI002889AD3E|nr:S9 family peptidase [Pontibacter sp. G13]WNJ20349.1 S9 family peptidase [Pontibacter sp. G13]